MSIFDKITKFFDNRKEDNQEFETTIVNATAEYTNIDTYFWNIKFALIQTNTDTVKKWPDEKKVSFITYLTEKVSNYNKKNSQNYTKYNSTKYNEIQLSCQYIDYLLKSTLTLNDDLIASLFYAFKENKKDTHTNFLGWPIAYYIKQIENYLKTNLLSPVLENVLRNCRTELQQINNSYSDKQKIQLTERIDNILFKAANESNAVRPTLFIGEDEFTNYGNSIIFNQKEEDKILWYPILALAQKATGSKPSKKYLDESKKLIDYIGNDAFKKTTQDWFNFIIHLKERTTEHTYTYGNNTYTHLSSEFLSALNTECLKGLVWMNSLFYDNKTIQTISKLAERCFKKISQKGPAAGAIGNACLYTLYTSKGLDGIAQLSRLRLKIKQNNTIAIIEKYINQAAEKLGISSTEIEDLAVDDFKLTEHKRIFDFAPFTCHIVLTGIGKSDLKWYKENGDEQKAVPSLIKEKMAAKLKKVKDIQKQIDQATTSQKERFDRMLRSNRQMPLSYFKEKYLAHGLLSFVVKKMIFSFINENDQKVAIQSDQEWTGVDGEKIDIERYTTVQLWHPVNSTTAEVRNWRQFLVEKQIQQPFKQAFREIYLLTEAEINTRTYSNRMASHILKQHQYVTLAKGRNWSSRLIGAWDGGDQDTAVLNLPEYGLRAEYWVNALSADDAFNDTGIWNYVTTDQIRFIDSSNNEPLELINIPPVIFSEVLRDVDLFVGVASVGNDPTWQDSGGLPTYRDYWQSYSFGDLSEIAKNRKEILTSLIPRLKISDITTIEDKFVIVKGKIRTYKIHIGSTNILMEPNDQYLCIVPDRSKKSETEHVFLPFEGDTGLSIIISKAFLLANDDKITDASITSQINR